MQLLIDIGNTRLKWAVAPSPAAGSKGGAAPDPHAWFACEAIVHAEIPGVGAGWMRFPIDGILISNVAGPAIAAQVLDELRCVRTEAAMLPPVRWFVAEAETAGVRNRYRNPAQLGCDRLAALVGARALQPGRDLIIATCGTATTVDALTADGSFIGGMILPGLATMAYSLARGTAQLPMLATMPPEAPPKAPPAAPDGTPGNILPSLFADHTEAAMRNGCLAAQAGAIERAVAAHGNAFCLLSGGAAPWIAPLLQVSHAVQESLVLIGLQVIAAAQPERFSMQPSQPDVTGVTCRPEANNTC